MADDAASLLAGDRSEQDSEAEADADAGQQRRETRAAAVRGQVGGSFLRDVVGIARILAFAEQAVHGCPHSGIGGKQTELKNKAEPIGGFRASGRDTHGNFFPRGRCAGIDKTIFSEGRWALLSVDSCIEVVKGLYGSIFTTGTQRHGEMRELGLCLGSQGCVMGITQRVFVLAWKRVRGADFHGNRSF